MITLPAACHIFPMVLCQTAIILGAEVQLVGGRGLPPPPPRME